MYEPLLEVAIPGDVARPGRSFRAGYAIAEKIVVLQQIFTNVVAQDNLRNTCRLLAAAGGVRLITVEGADNEVRPRPEATSVASLMGQRCRVSAGVEVMLNVDRPDVEVWGVDDLDSEARSLTAMTLANSGRKQCDQTFQALRPILQDAQLHCYTPRVSRVQALRCALYGRWVEMSTSPGLDNYAKSLSRPFTRVVSEIVDCSTAEGLNLGEFPSIPLYHRLLGQEKRFRQRRVNHEQKTFVKRLVSRIVSGTGGPNGVDLERIGPVIEFWAEQNEISNDEFNKAVDSAVASPF